MENDLKCQPSGAIRITRVSQSLDTRRAFKIYVDGKEFGGIRIGESILLPTSFGSHVLSARIDWVKSGPFEIYVNQGEELLIQVDCAGFNARNIIYILVLLGVLTSLGRLAAGNVGGAIAGGIAAFIVASRAGRPRLTQILPEKGAGKGLQGKGTRLL
jgi:hypothetical protein